MNYVIVRTDGKWTRAVAGPYTERDRVVKLASALARENISNTYKLYTFDGSRLVNKENCDELHDNKYG